MAKEIQIEKIAIKFGLPTAIAFILFFLLMRAVGFADILELRALNFFILLAGIFLALRYEKKNEQAFPYLKGLGIGIATSAVALIIFCVFLAIYLAALDPAFMRAVKEDEMFGHLLNPYIAASAVFFEGLLSGALISFIFMQYFKKSHLSSEERLQ